MRNIKESALNNLFLKREFPTLFKQGCRFVLASKKFDLHNPFLLKTYDFDKGFYQGKFKFIDPLSKEEISGTPEEYGRRRLLAYLEKLDPKGKTILDLGAGTLNIYLQITDTFKKDLLYFINCDISGPWNSLGKSSMEIGIERMNKNLENVTNVQYDFNELV